MRDLDDPAVAADFAAAGRRLGRICEPYVVFGGLCRRMWRITMAILSRGAILAAQGPDIEKVPVPEWGGEVILRGMTGRERDQFEASLLVQRGRKQVTDVDNLRAKVVARCAIDEHGDRLFTDADAEELGNKSAAALSRVYEVAARLSAIGDDDLDELAQRITEDPTSGSPSNSPAPSGAPAETSS